MRIGIINRPLTRRALAAALLLTHAAPVWAGDAAEPVSRLDVPWWRARHQAKRLESRGAHPRLIFLGDSITQNWERDGTDPAYQFVPVWRYFYGDRDAVNLGFSGDTTANLLWRIENGEVDDIAPKVAVVLIGANNLGGPHDPAPQVASGIDAIVRALHRRLPATHFLLLGILPSERSDWITDTARTINRDLAAKYANDPSLTFFDADHVFMKDGRLDRDLFYDPKADPPFPPLHPSAQGQALLAAAIEPMLARLLGDQPRPPSGPWDTAPEPGNNKQ